MGWMWAVAVLVVLIGAGMLIDRRRYRGLPVPPELTGRARRRAIRQARAAMGRSQTPPRDTGYEGQRAGGDGAG